jgi:hypothetical protein
VNYAPPRLHLLDVTTSNVLAQLAPSVARPGVRTQPVESPKMVDAVAHLIDSCDHYAATYAGQRRQPIGCDPTRGPILLGVLRALSALAANDDQRERVLDIISSHALDLEE